MNYTYHQQDGVNLTLSSGWYGLHVGLMTPELTIFEQKGAELAHWYGTTKVIWLSVAYGAVISGKNVLFNKQKLRKSDSHLSIKD